MRGTQHLFTALAHVMPHPQNPAHSIALKHLTVIISTDTGKEPTSIEKLQEQLQLVKQANLDVLAKQVCRQLCLSCMPAPNTMGGFRVWCMLRGNLPPCFSTPSLLSDAPHIRHRHMAQFTLPKLCVM